jgi:FkbM family methyltransferase
MFAMSGMTGVTGNLYVGLHEFEPMAFLLHFLRRGDLFADIGANVGSYSILAGAAVGADAIAFEPGEAFPWLVRNLELNDLRSVDARREAVGATEGRVQFTSGLDTMNRINPTSSNSVPLTTLDAACHSRIPTLVKIDVEGFEADVLRGSANTLRKSTQAVIMELNDPEATQLLRHAGFTRCDYNPFTRSLAESVTATSNGVFIKGISSARERVSTAQPFSVRGWTI